MHLCDSLDELSAYEGQLAAGLIPDRPFLLIGQMTTADPSRSPAGTESLWAYTHVPQRVRGDAGGRLTGDWDDGDAERFADRMQARIEAYAPGFGSRVLARRVLSPPELERRNANLVGGAVGRWLLGPGPAADLPTRARAGPGGHPDPRALPGLGLGAPRRCRARGGRGQRGPGRPVGRSALAPAGPAPIGSPS